MTTPVAFAGLAGSAPASRALAAEAPPPGEGHRTWASELQQACTWLGGVIDEREEGLAAMPDDHLGDVLCLANGLIAKLTALKAATMRAKERNGAYRREGHRNVSDWNATITGNGKAIASREARLAEDLGTLPEVEKCLNDGEIAPEHALVFSRMMRSGDTDARRAAMDDGAARDLLDLARRQDPGRFGKSAERRANAIDRNALQRDFDVVRAKRYLRTRPQAGGLYGEFFLDRVAGEQLQVALEAQQARPLADDDRTYEQRRADALVDLGQVALDSGQSKKGALVRPHVIVTMPAETLAAARAAEAERQHRARARAAREEREHEAQHDRQDERPDSARAEGRREDPGDARPGIGGKEPDCGSVSERLREVAPAAEFPDGSLIPPRQLGQLLCDSEIGRVVIGALGVPLDAGRTARTASDELRAAVIARDRHCRFPGCDTPARWTHFHHIVWWSKGGSTSADNGILLCDHHHTNWIHGRGVVIIPFPGGFEFREQGGALVGRTYHDGVVPGQGHLEIVR